MVRVLSAATSPRAVRQGSRHPRIHGSDRGQQVGVDIRELGFELRGVDDQPTPDHRAGPGDLGQDGGE